MSMVMVICTLLMLMVRTDISKQRVEDKTATMYAAIDEIGAKFVASGGTKIEGSSGDNTYKGYYCRIDADESGNRTLTVQSGENGDTLLTVVIDMSNNILKWEKNY